MRKFVCIVTVLLSIVVTVKAQDYEALGKFIVRIGLEAITSK